MTDRTGLYIMMFIAMLTTCVNNTKIDSVKEKVSKIEKKIEEPIPQIQTRDVIGQETPDKFYEIDGRKVYFEIDGKPVEDYFQR